MRVLSQKVQKYDIPEETLSKDTQEGKDQSYETLEIKFTNVSQHESYSKTTITKT